MVYDELILKGIVIQGGVLGRTGVRRRVRWSQNLAQHATSSIRMHPRLHSIDSLQNTQKAEHRRWNSAPRGGNTIILKKEERQLWHRPHRQRLEHHPFRWPIWFGTSSRQVLCSRFDCSCLQGQSTMYLSAGSAQLWINQRRSAQWCPQRYVQSWSARASRIYRNSQDALDELRRMDTKDDSGSRAGSRRAYATVRQLQKWPAARSTHESSGEPTCR